MTHADSFEAAFATHAIRVGSIVGARFRVDEEIHDESRPGSRDGSRLYRATDSETARAPGSDAATAAVAGTVLRIIPVSALGLTPESLLNVMNRARALQHKNLVELTAVGRERDFLYVATEFVDGQTLRAFIDGKRAEGRGVSLKGAANLVAHVANALEHARHLGPHGALNPELILVNRTGRVKVNGLGLGVGLPGLARLGYPTGAADTLYLAPEIVAGGPPTAAGDVYALGAILYELLTSDAVTFPLRPVSEVVPGIPAAIDGVVERALAAAPESRWPNASSLKTAMQSAAAGLPMPPVPAVLSPAPGTGVGAAAGGDVLGRPTEPGFAHDPAMGVARAYPGAPRTHGPLAPVPGSGKTVMGGGSGGGVGGIATGHGQPATNAFQSQSDSGGGSAGAGFDGDDQDERWLVQKGNLDFGPFSMAQIRAQIERGEILADHTILDNTSGARRLVKELPGLGDLAKQAHRRMERTRREHAEQRSQKTQKKKSMVTTAIVTLVVAGVLGAAVFYVLSRRDTSGGRLASREEEVEVETFLKGVKIGGMKATVKRGGGHRGQGASAGAGDDFNNDAHFGDATRGMAQGDQTLDDDQIQGTMLANYRKLIPCIAHAPGMSNLAIDFVVRGTGKVSAVKVNGQRNGALPSCVFGRMQAFNFPRFEGTKTIASWSMSMGR